MNKKTKLLIPTFAAVFALVFAFATPYVMAEKDRFGDWGNGTHPMGHMGFGDWDNGTNTMEHLGSMSFGSWGNGTHPMWHDGPMGFGAPMGFSEHMGHKGKLGMSLAPIEGFTGSIQIPDKFDNQTRNDLKNQITVSLLDAVSTANGNGFTDGMNAHLGIVSDDQGNKYLVWIISGTNKNQDSGTITVNTFIVDAGNKDNTAQVSKDFDPTLKSEKFANHFAPFKSNFQNLDNQTKTDLQNALQNLKTAKNSGDQNQIDQAKQELKSLLDSIKTQN